MRCRYICSQVPSHEQHGCLRSRCPGVARCGWEQQQSSSGAVEEQQHVSRGAAQEQQGVSKRAAEEQLRSSSTAAWGVSDGQHRSNTRSGEEHQRSECADRSGQMWSSLFARLRFSTEIRPKQSAYLCVFQRSTAKSICTHPLRLRNMRSLSGYEQQEN